MCSRKYLDLLGLPFTHHSYRARDSLSLVLEPLLDFVTKITKTHATIVIGAPPPQGCKKFFIKAIHSGTSTDGKRWSTFDPERFDTAMKSFCHFLTNTECE